MNKNIIVIIVILFSGKICSAQLGTYLPINYNPSTYWNMNYTVYSGGSADCHAEQTFEVKSDTFINSKQYWKIKNYFNYFWSGSTGICPLYFNSYQNSYFYLREDSIQRKVYQLDMDSLKEIELINFGLMQNDTLNLANKMKFKIDTITIENINGVNRRCQYFTNFFTQYKTIEGIGCSINFPLSGYGEWATPVFNLQCFNNYGNNLFVDNNYSKPCDKYPQIFLSTNDFIKQKVELDQLEKSLILKNINNLKLDIKLYSIEGKELKHISSQEKFYSIDLSSLIEGIYIIQINSYDFQLNKKINVK